MSFIDMSRSNMIVQELQSVSAQFNTSKNYSDRMHESMSVEAETVLNGVTAKRAYLNKNNVLKYTYEKERKYNPYLIPPDWKAAKRHGQARRVGRNLTPTGLNTEEMYEVCPCCDYQIEKSPMHLMEHVSSLSFLGSGYPLFFHYMKYCIMILGLIILTSGEFNLLSNFFGGSCITSDQKAADPSKYSRRVCVMDWISMWSIANKDKKIDYAEIQDILNFSTIIVLMILLVLFRKEQKEIDVQCDVAELTPADYTIMMKDLPSMVTKKHIREFFESGEIGRKLRVVEVNLVYDISERVIKQVNIDDVIVQKKKALRKIPYSDAFIREGEKWDKAIDHECKNLELLNLKIEEDPMKFSGFAFVSFETEEEKQYVLSTMASTSLMKEILNSVFFQQNDFKQLDFKGIMIEVGEAPEPLDIIWENLHQPTTFRNVRRFMSFTITVILLLVCSVLVYTLIKFQTDEIKQFQKDHATELADEPDVSLLLKEQLPNAIVSFCLVCINSVLIEILFRQIVNIECHITYTLYDINLAQKLSLTLFLNTAIITCCLNVFYTRNIFGKGGLIYTIFYFFVVNAGSSFVSVLFDPMYYLRKILIWWHKRKGKKCNLTQQEANKLSESPVHEIEIGYVDVMKTMYITIFYSPVVPLGLLISLVGLVFYYWAQKFAVMKERVIDKQISVKLSLEMTEYLEFIISIYTASNLLFKYETVGSLSYLQVIGFVIGVLYSVLPVQLCIEKIFFFGGNNETVPYSIARSSFITTYALANPITRAKAKKKQQQDVHDFYMKEECV